MKKDLFVSFGLAHHNEGVKVLGHESWMKQARVPSVKKISILRGNIKQIGKKISQIST